MGIFCDHKDRLLKLHCNAVSDGNELIVYQKISKFKIVNDLIDIFSEFMFADGIFKCITFLEYHFLNQTHIFLKLMI